MGNIQRAAYRLNREPMPPLLLGARSTGYYKLSGHWEQSPKTPSFLELFWSLSGTIEFIVEKKIQLLHRNEAIFYLPGDLHMERLLSSEADMYWLTIDGSELPRLVSTGMFPRTAFSAGPCPEADFQQLFQDVGEPGPAAQFRAAGRALMLMYQALAGSQPGEDAAERSWLSRAFEQLVRRQFNRVECNVDTLASQLGVHRGTLHREFKRDTGTTPLEYLEHYRLSHALQLLTGTSLSIAEVARHCGYAAPNYFTKVVRRRIGRKPSEIRKKF